MDTCEILDIVARTIVLVASIGSLVDCCWRHIPRAITTFRVLLMAYSILAILRQIVRAESNVIAEGALAVLVSGFIWPIGLCFLEHFARVFLTIDLKGQTKDLSILFKTFTVGRIALFVSFTVLAITFGFVPVNGIMFGKRVITVACNLFVVLPVCVTTLGLIFALRSHRKTSFDDDSERAKKLKATYRQLVAFFVMLSSACLVALLLNVRGMIDEVEFINAPWVSPECSTGSAFYVTIPFILALYLTRFPNAQRRKRNPFSSTQNMSDSSRTDGASKRSSLKQPPIAITTTVCVASTSNQLERAREV